MSEKLNLVDLLFRHKTSQNAECLSGDEIGIIYRPAESVLSPARGPRARKEVKTSGATKLYDQLFITDESVLYPSSLRCLYKIVAHNLRS